MLKVGGIVRSFNVVLQICFRSHAAHLMDLLCKQGNICRGQGPTGSSGSSVVRGTDLVSGKHKDLRKLSQHRILAIRSTTEEPKLILLKH